MPRYLSLVRIDEKNAPAEGPSPELMQRMGELIEEMTKAGVLLDTAGLTPTDQGVRVHDEGATAACHARAYTYEKTDWASIARLHGLLAARAPSPVVELNRAVATRHGRRPGCGPGRRRRPVRRTRPARLPPAAERPRRPARPPRPPDGGPRGITRAAFLARNERERELLEARARECG
ncbi:hypothetical protein GCM10010254_54500 [Streptomyces chromofuscus]|nr:hypothetical protein GCM10010254_54500 [Streptomyces chromofuscus]